MAEPEKKFIRVTDEYCHYTLVVNDMEHARRILCEHGIEAGDPSVPICDAKHVVWEELSAERASQIFCNTDDDDRGRGRIPLTQADIGEWFSNEW